VLPALSLLITMGDDLGDVVVLFECMRALADLAEAVENRRDVSYAVINDLVAVLQKADPARTGNAGRDYDAKQGMRKVRVQALRCVLNAIAPAGAKEYETEEDPEVVPGRFGCTEHVEYGMVESNDMNDDEEGGAEWWEEEEKPEPGEERHRRQSLDVELDGIAETGAGTTGDSSLLPGGQGMELGEGALPTAPPKPRGPTPSKTQLLFKRANQIIQTQARRPGDGSPDAAGQRKHRRVSVEVLQSIVALSVVTAGAPQAGGSRGFLTPLSIFLPPFIRF
jgi:hypothetical protein